MADAAVPLDTAAVLAALGARPFRLDVYDTCSSTNDVLLTSAEAGAHSGSVVVCERQTAGRGRRGRVWHAAPGASLTFSVLWRFPPERDLSGLSLAVGVALARALEDLGAAGIGLKWPNDVLGGGRKLAGILIETVFGADRAAVIGIGINLRLPRGLADRVPADAGALEDVLAQVPSREALLARLLAQLEDVLQVFTAGGFAPFQEEWIRRNAYAGVVVRVGPEAGDAVIGRCLAVDADGALLLEVNDAVRRVVSGELSLRPQ